MYSVPCNEESMLQVGEYLDILKAKKSAKEACSAFFCYAVAVRAKYLQLLLLYYRFISHFYANLTFFLSFNQDQQRVQQEIQGFNFDVWLMAKK